MAASENIGLTVEETGVFIDLWEAQPALWDTRCESYKDRRARLAARKYIAEAMGRLWNEEQVERKILSLKGNYNNERRKLQEGLTKTGKGKTKKIWPHYDRLKRFLMTTEYDPDKSAVGEEYIKLSSPIPTETGTPTLLSPPAKLSGEPQPRILVKTFATPLATLSKSETQALVAASDRNHHHHHHHHHPAFPTSETHPMVTASDRYQLHSPQAFTTASDRNYQTPSLPKVETDSQLFVTTSRNRVQLPAPPKTEPEGQLFVTTSGMDQHTSGSRSPASSTSEPDSPSPSSRASPIPSKKRAVASSSSKRPVEEGLPQCRGVSQLADLAEWTQVMQSSSEVVYGMYVAECLGKIRCERRRMMVRKRINDIFHEAIMEELSE